MSTLNPEAVIQGKAYLIWIKDSTEYADPDYFYGVAFKGNSRFGHSDFSYVCKNRNKKVFFSKCINEGQEDPTWQECLLAMEMGKAPVGNPKLLTDRAYTFAEIAMLAYQAKYFTDQEGLQVVSKKTAPSKVALATTKSGPSAKEASDELDKNNTEEEEVQDSGNEKDMSLEDWKERAILAESKLTNTMRERDLLEGKVVELKVKLEASLEQQNRYMSAADNATMTVESMNDDMATKVIKKVVPKLSKIETMDNNLSTVLAKLGDLGAAVASIPLLMNKLQEVSNKVDTVGSRMESSCESLSEGVYTVEKTLSTFGIDEGEVIIDIPSNIKTMVEKLLGGESNNHADNSALGGARNLDHGGGSTRQVVLAPVPPGPISQAQLPQAPVLQAPILQAPVLQSPVFQSPVLQAPVRNTIPQYPPTTPVSAHPGSSQYFAQSRMNNPTYQHYNPVGQVTPPENHLYQQPHGHAQGQVYGQSQRQFHVQGQGQDQGYVQGQGHDQRYVQDQEEVHITRRQRKFARTQEFKMKKAAKKLKLTEEEIYNQSYDGGQRGGANPSNNGEPNPSSGSRQGHGAPNWGSGRVWQSQQR